MKHESLLKVNVTSHGCTPKNGIVRSESNTAHVKDLGSAPEYDSHDAYLSLEHTAEGKAGARTSGSSSELAAPSKLCVESGAEPGFHLCEVPPLPRLFGDHFLSPVFKPPEIAAPARPTPGFHAAAAPRPANASPRLGAVVRAFNIPTSLDIDSEVSLSSLLMAPYADAPNRRAVCCTAVSTGLYDAAAASRRIVLLSPEDTHSLTPAKAAAVSAAAPAFGE
jgi:hypothetical protein